MLERNVRIEKFPGALEGKDLWAKKGTRPLTAIRLFCGECMGMDRRVDRIEYPLEDVRTCTDPMCPLFEYRLGKNPYHTRKVTPDTRKANIEALTRARLARGSSK